MLMRLNVADVAIAAVTISPSSEKARVRLSIFWHLSPNPTASLFFGDSSSAFLSRLFFFFFVCFFSFGFKTKSIRKKNPWETKLVLSDCLCYARRPMENEFSLSQHLCCSWKEWHTFFFLFFLIFGGVFLSGSYFTSRAAARPNRLIVYSLTTWIGRCVSASTSSSWKNQNVENEKRKRSSFRALESSTMCNIRLSNDDKDVHILSSSFFPILFLIRPVPVASQYWRRVWR